MEGKFDFIHARFLLSHLPDPAAALGRMRRGLRPGGVLAVEDVDFSGHFAYPPCPALDRYVALYSAVARERGADAHIGPRLPSIFAAAGFATVHMNVVQPVDGEAKLMSPITMEKLAPAVLSAGLATKGEIDGIVDALCAHAHAAGTIASLPRIFEVWGS